MKGKIPSLLGSINYQILSNGIVMLETPPMRQHYFQGEKFTFLGRIEKNDLGVSIFRLIKITQILNESLKSSLSDVCLSAWVDYLKKHPSVRVLAKTEKEIEKRDKAIANLQNLVCKFEVQFNQMKLELEKLKELKA